MRTTNAVQRILRWEVPVDDAPHPIGGGQIVHIATRRDRFPRGDKVEVWTAEPQLRPELLTVKPTRLVQVVGTAQAFPPDWRPLGSALALDGVLVWHVCELDESSEVQG